MNDAAMLHHAISEPLLARGFSRAGDSWYRVSNETICVVNLQKSDYGREYFVNLGVWLNALGKAGTPKEYQCHLRLRLGALLPESPGKVQALFCFDDNASLANVERERAIREVFESFVIPFVMSAKSIASLRVLHNSDRWPRGCLVHRDARALLVGVGRQNDVPPKNE